MEVKEKRGKGRLTYYTLDGKLYEMPRAKDSGHKKYMIQLLKDSVGKGKEPHPSMIPFRFRESFNPKSLTEPTKSTKPAQPTQPTTSTRPTQPAQPQPADQGRRYEQEHQSSYGRHRRDDPYYRDGRYHREEPCRRYDYYSRDEPHYRDERYRRDEPSYRDDHYHYGPYQGPTLQPPSNPQWRSSPYSRAMAPVNSSTSTQPAKYMEETTRDA
ncbi:hypothetical protein F5884DRAFT_773556 [Xylogone sp. PMI_703]|nr:hypothetical protein F5884DRAFT_773556 [Xylogone sp. PMI_703]